jgi:hypothetical protein
MESDIVFYVCASQVNLYWGADIKTNVGATRGGLSPPTRAVRLTS